MHVVKKEKKAFWLIKRALIEGLILRVKLNLGVL
jgi:hypothetical protein